MRREIERIEEKQLVPVLVLRKEHEETKELPIEALDVPISQLLKIYKSREVPRRWNIQ
jgi:hypothetical protein